MSKQNSNTECDSPQESVVIPKVLHLTLKKKWFDMIAEGIKDEEYREVKDYWEKRLVDKDYDVICFRNGYNKNAPEVTVEFKGLCVGFGFTEWGAPEDETVFKLKLGKILKV